MSMKMFLGSLFMTTSYMHSPSCVCVVAVYLHTVAVSGGRVDGPTPHDLYICGPNSYQILILYCNHIHHHACSCNV